MKTEFHFLIVEDNELDIEKIERSFKKLNISNPYYIANNGLEALSILRGEDGVEKIRQPYIILLDLNMPKMNGIEFLQELRLDEELKSAPVFVLTTSDRKEDVNDAYKYNVAGYIVKPIDRAEMISAISKLDAYWSLCTYPGEVL